MTVLGALVFGGLLILGVLWLVVTAPGSEADQASNDALWVDHVDAVPALAGSRR